MLITGLVYTLVGIKNRWIHTFFSTAYMASLGVAVLIVYVMSVPISNALQGGFITAVILSGCALGGLSLAFKELTEGLGCALGGFCVSMWLLCLVPGGLLDTVTSKAIFIACFTLVAFAFYFSRYTRDWALITMISFAGATVVVLGIDCFSRAGLKEFWAYVWHLNKNLFPLGANTYPVTKGIRVETAAIIILFLVGIVSQIKLWRIVREKREQRAAQRAEGQRTVEQEDEEVGRQIEETTAREREEWEKAYGNGDSSTASRTSGDVSCEKKMKEAYVRPTEVDVIEMTDFSGSDRDQSTTEVATEKPGPLTEKDENGKVTIRIATDDVPEYSEESDNEQEEREAEFAHSESRRQSAPVQEGRRSHAAAVSEAPEVVPLPFTIPKGEEDDSKSLSDQSSAATFADEEAGGRRDSLAKRLSQSSSKLLRGLSHRSGHMRNDSALENGESSEDLVIRKADREDDESSVAATLDGQSIDDSVRRSLSVVERGPSIEITAQMSDGDVKQVTERSPRTSLAKDSKQDSEKLQAVPPEKAPRSSVDASQDAPNERSDADNAKSPENRSLVDQAEGSLRDQKSKSVSSGISPPVSLTKEHLPRPLSRVALSYRTNEWAKHLSYADAPEPDELHVIEAAKPSKRKSKKEQPAPLDVEELQKGAEDGAQPPAMMRSDSRLSNVSMTRSAPRDLPRGGSPPNPVPEREQAFSPPLPQGSNAGMTRASSSMALRRASNTFAPIAEENDYSNSPDPIAEEQDDTRRTSTNTSLSRNDQTHPQGPIPGIVSYSDPQTLLGQRESFLRSKSQGNLLATMQTPDTYYQTSRPTSEAGSLANYPMYAAAMTSDPDDIPLSQRKQMMMRQNSMMALTGHNPVSRVSSGINLSDNTKFNSHQPKRNSSLPTPAAREAQLANFRSSVATDLRSGTPMITPSGRETPFASTSNLLASGREAEVRQNIEMQRSILMGRKEAEAQRKEMSRLERESTDRAFDQRMRSGELMDAHREAMRRMQKGARE